jgi:HPt (histidine-containing phosphotransfer) domain-containing protein
MDDYVSKPVRPQQLFETIERVLSQLAETRWATGSREGAAAVGKEAGDRGQGAGGVVNWEEALVNVGEDRALLQDIVALFLANSPRLLNELRAAIESQSAAGVRKAAHRFKGETQTLGAQRASEQAWRLEQMGKENQLSQASEALQQLEIELERLRRELESFVGKQT